MKTSEAKHKNGTPAEKTNSGFGSLQERELDYSANASGIDQLDLPRYMDRERRRDNAVWNATRNPEALTLLRIQVQRRKVDDYIVEAGQKARGFAFNRKSFGIEFEKRWNSIYPHSVIRPDWKENFQKFFKSKYHGMSNSDIWNSLKVNKSTPMEETAEHFKTLQSGEVFWRGLTSTQKATMWPDIAFWLMLNSPTDVLTFLESTHNWPYPPFRMASECFLFLDAFHYADLTLTLESKERYYRLMRDIIGPNNWPALSVSQRGIRVYLKHCDQDQLAKALAKGVNEEVYLSPTTLLYFMDRFIEYKDTENALRSLQLIPSRVNEWVTVRSVEIARRCAALLALDTTCETDGIRSFRLLPEILKVGLKPRREMMSIIIQNALKIGDPDMAWDIFNYSETRPDSYTYLALLDDAATRGDSHRLETCYRLVSSNPAIRCEPHILSKTLHALFSLLENSSAGAEFRVFNAMLQVYCQGHDPQPLKDLGIIEPAQEQDLPQHSSTPPPPSPHSLVIIISAYLRLYKNTTRAIELYHLFCELVRQGHDPIGRLAETDHIYNAFLTAIQGDERMIDEAIAIVRNMYTPLPSDTARLGENSRPIQQAAPTAITWHILLTMVMFHRRLENIDQILKMMRERNVPMDTSAWNALMMGHAKLQMVDSTVMVLEAMLMGGLSPNEYTSRALRLIRNQDRLRRALDELNIDADTLTFRSRAVKGEQGPVSQTQLDEGATGDIRRFKEEYE